MTTKDIKTDILWTGGWDSTFRLLELLLIKNRLVQPYYVLNPQRPSTEIEIKTMDKIKQRLFKEHSEAKELLLPTIFKKKDKITANLDITQSLQRISKKNFIGDQYDWLARFVAESGIKEMEICIEWTPKFERVLGAFLIRYGSENDFNYKIADKFAGTDEYIVWNRSRFPIIKLTKPEMEKESKRLGFFDYMNLTWFCYNPGNDYKPCGVCNPCLFVLQRGLSWRLPFFSRIKCHLRNISIKAKKQLKQHPKYYYFIKNVKNKIFNQHLTL